MHSRLAFAARLIRGRMPIPVGRRQRSTATQVSVPYPPYEWSPEPGFAPRPHHDELPSQSYPNHHVRLWLANRVVELVRRPGRPSARPADLGIDAPVLVLSGWCPPSQRATALDNAVSLARFEDALTDLLQLHQAHGERHKAVLLPQNRAWVEVGEGITGVPLATVAGFVRSRGMRGFAVWDADGLRYEFAEGRATIPAGVALRDVPAGCPMQLTHPQRRCEQIGGPWTTASQRAALFWGAHQRMLIGALGCGICDGDLAGRTEVIAGGELVQPSRVGGWDFSGPTTTVARLRPKE